jgi:heme exporter protein D
MDWSSLSDFWKACVQFFYMGGYGLYVWGSYGVTFVLLGGEVLMLLKCKRDLARREHPREFADRDSQLENSFQEVQ